jgi:hypothetical protein
VVVHRSDQIAEARDLVLSHYPLVYCRPKDDVVTHMPASQFEFDDLRLYVQRPPHERGQHADLDHLVFEAQIKTVLQHAWSLATHDLIYKTDDVSWSKERIAFQIKAMLEHAEISIREAGPLSEAINRRDRRTQEMLRVLEIADKFWDAASLPENRRLFASSVLTVLSIAAVEVDQLETIIRTEVNRLTCLPEDLSPYALIVQAIAQVDSSRLEGRMRKSDPRKLVVHRDMDLPDWMWVDHPRIVNIERGLSSGESTAELDDESDAEDFSAS